MKREIMGFDILTGELVYREKKHKKKNYKKILKSLKKLKKSDDVIIVDSIEWMVNEDEK